MTDDDVRYVGLGDDTTSHNDTFLRLFMTMTPKIDDDKKCTAFSLILSPVIISYRRPFQSIVGYRIGWH